MDLKSQTSDFGIQKISMNDGEPPSAGITRSGKTHRATLVAAQSSGTRDTHEAAEDAWVPCYSGTRNDCGQRRQ